MRSLLWSRFELGLEGNLPAAIKAWSEAVVIYNQIQQAVSPSGAKSVEHASLIDRINALYHNQALAYDKLGETEKAVVYWEKVVNNWRRTSKGASLLKSSLARILARIFGTDFGTDLC